MPDGSVTTWTILAAMASPPPPSPNSILALCRSDATARLAIEWGAQSYLIKPLATPQLKQAIDRHLRAHREVRRERKILAVNDRIEQENETLRVQFAQSLEGMWMAFQPIVS